MIILLYLLIPLGSCTFYSKDLSCYEPAVSPPLISQQFKTFSKDSVLHCSKLCLTNACNLFETSGKFSF